IEHRLAAAPFAADPGSAGHPIDDVISEVAPRFRSVSREQRLLIGFGHVHATAHTVISSISSGSGRVFALRPARSIGLSISALWRSMMLQKSSARSSSSLEASLSVSLVRTCRTLFCMSSASQPRECAMKGNGGNTKPSSAQKVNIAPGIALGDGTRPRTGARRLRVVALTMTELEITQFDVLRIGSAALRLVQGVLEQRVRRGEARVHVVHRCGGDDQHTWRRSGGLGVD